MISTPPVAWAARSWSGESGRSAASFRKWIERSPRVRSSCSLVGAARMTSVILPRRPVGICGLCLGGTEP
eukprot:8516147-Alexandrium_andersonii.AAC.1